MNRIPLRFPAVGSIVEHFAVHIVDNDLHRAVWLQVEIYINPTPGSIEIFGSIRFIITDIFQSFLFPKPLKLSLNPFSFLCFAYSVVINDDGGFKLFEVGFLLYGAFLLVVFIRRSSNPAGDYMLSLETNDVKKESLGWNISCIYISQLPNIYCFSYFSSDVFWPLALFWKLKAA